MQQYTPWFEDEEIRDLGMMGEGTNKFQDPAFVHQLLGSLPGVDPNDPMIREAVESHLNVSDANDDEQKKNEKSEKKDDNEKK